MKQIFNFFAPFVLLMFLTCCLGCYFQQFYKTNTTHKVAGRALEQLRAANKYFIVHTPDKSFSLRNVNVSGEILSGDMDSLNPKYVKYLNPEVDKGNRFPGREEEMALAEVHLYTNSSFDGNGPVSLPVNQISRMDVYDLDSASSRGFRILSTVGFTLGMVVIIGVSFKIKDVINY